MQLEPNIRHLPLGVRCAIEMLGTLAQGERTQARLDGFLTHYLTVYGMEDVPERPFYLASAWAIAKRRYYIDDAEVGGAK